MFYYIKSEKNFLFSIFVLSLIVRLLFFTSILRNGDGSWIIFDSQQYHDVAVNIAEGKGVCQKDGKINFYRLPGYPVFLSIGYKLFNFDIAKTLLMQVIVMSVIPIFLFILSLLLFPFRLVLAKTISCYAALHIGFVMYAGMLATEMLFLLLFLSFFIVFMYALQRNVCLTKNSMMAGALLGAASLVRPVGHFVLIIAIGLLLISSYSGLEKIKASFVLVVSWFLVVGSWLLRNWLLTGYIFFHTLPGLHFMQYIGANVYKERNACTYFEARRTLLQEWDDRSLRKEQAVGRQLYDIERCNIAEKIASEIIHDNKLLTIKYAFIQLLKTVFALHGSHILLIDQGWPNYTDDTTFVEKIKTYLIPQVSSWWLVLLIYMDMLMLLFQLTGVMLFLCLYIWRDRLFKVATRMLPFAGLLILLTLAYGNARLRLPVEPFLIVMSWYAWLRFLGLEKKSCE